MIDVGWVLDAEYGTASTYSSEEVRIFAVAVPPSAGHFDDASPGEEGPSDRALLNGDTSIRRIQIGNKALVEIADNADSSMNE